MSQLNDLEHTGQGQRSSCATYPLMRVIIHAKYGKNSSWTVCAVKQTRQDVPYFSSFITKSKWLNDLKDIGQGQRSLWATPPPTTHHPYPPPLMPVIICDQFGKNPSRTVHAVERTWQNVPYFSSHSWMNLKIFIICDTPSHTSDPLCPIWKESMQKCTYCTADTKRCAIF